MQAALPIITRCYKGADGVSNIATIITEITALIPIVVAIIYILNGLKCLLRNEMLRIYYSHKEKAEAEGKDTVVIRQYAIENFVFLYKAYKALKGNSFIDKIYKEIMEEWETIS